MKQIKKREIDDAVMIVIVSELYQKQHSRSIELLFVNITSKITFQNFILTLRNFICLKMKSRIETFAYSNVKKQKNSKNVEKNKIFIIDYVIEHVIKQNYFVKKKHSSIQRHRFF